MKKIFLFLCLFVLSFVMKAQFSPVHCTGPWGGAGAIGDPALWTYIAQSGNPSDPSTGRGSVSYNYSYLDRFVRIGDYVNFLNSADPTNSLNFEGELVTMGYIEFSGNWHTIPWSSCSGSSGQSLTASQVSKCAVHYVSFNQAARFANWVATGNVNTGAYTFASSDGNANISSINSSFTGVRLPTENEFYKAAYYNPSTSSYNLYGTTSLNGSGEPEVGTVSSTGIISPSNGHAYNLPAHLWVGPSGLHCLWAVQSGQGGKSAYGLFNMVGGFHHYLTDGFTAGSAVLRPQNQVQGGAAEQSSAWSMTTAGGLSMTDFYASPSFHLVIVGNSCGGCVAPTVGANMTVCKGNCVNLVGSAPTTGTWTAQAGNPTGATLGATTGGIANVCISPTATTGTYTFVYTNTATNCSSTMTITVPASPNSGVDKTTCFNNGAGTVTMSGSGTGTWSAVSGNPGTATITSPTSGTTAIHHFTSPGTYTFIRTNTSSCTDTVNVVVNPLVDAGNNINLTCLTTSGVIGTPAISGYTYSWLPTTGLSASNIAQPTASPSVTTVYTVTAVGGGCTATSTVTVNVSTAVGSVGNYVWNDINVNGLQDEVSSEGINGVVVELWKETTNGSGVYNLDQTTTTANNGSSNPGYYNFIICQSANYKVKFPTTNASLPLTTQTITSMTDNNSDASSIDGFSPVFAIDVNSSGLNKDNNTIDAGYISCIKPNAGNDATTCGGTCINLTGNNPTSGTWTALGSNPMGATLGTTLSGVAEVCFVNSASGVYNYIYNIGASCEDTMSISVTAKLDAGADQSICFMEGTNVVTMAAIGTGTWSAQSGNPGTSTITNINSPSTTITDFTVEGTYNFIWNNGTCGDTVSITVTPNGSIGNYVWLDINKNGLNDEPSSTGINGILVELWNATNNTFIASTTTANDGASNPGYYKFIVCENGDFKVKFPTSNGLNALTLQTTTIATDDNSDANVTTGFSPIFTIDVNGVGESKDNTTIDAGYKEPLKACLGNYVWNDINLDGTQNNGEVGVSGVTISLLNGTTNAIMATLTTDAYGYYQFCGLDAGDYKVKFSLPANYIFTGQNAPNDATDSDPNVFTGISDVVTLAPGDSNMTVDAGIYEPQPITATVGDRVWFDANENGLQDLAEYGVSGITVSLYNCSNLGTPIATTITDAGGNYLFENVTPGSYSVGFSVPIGMVFTTQSGNVSDATNSDVNVSTERTACFNVVGGDHLTYIDAGIKIKPTTTVSLGDKVWNDVNQDGLQDATETGVAGVTVTLYDATGTNVISTTTTDALGNYGFNGYPAGCYVIGFTAPSGYTFSAQNGGTDTTKNSDANATTGMTNQVCVSAGQNNPTIDAGIYNNANTNSIGDKVWYDENHDGLQDVTEYGYPGVVVTLYDCTSNTIIATTTTNASGNYLFDGIANGDYYVGFGFVTGFQFTGANSDIAGITGGNNSDANPSNGLTSCINLAGNTHITTIDAGIYPGSNRNATSSLGDIVWTDANNNGLQDNGETGVSNVTVNLYNCSDLNTPISTTITDGLGNYIFTGLIGGSYVVEFNPTTLPAGYTFTTLGTNIEDENNSDANVTTGKTSCIALGLGEDKMSVDAGIVAPVGTVCLGDYVWIDLDNDGTQEANEPAVPGVTVKLYDNNTNTVLQVATTNAEGKYMFCGLTNGSTYSVGFENLPAGFTFTTQTGALNVTDNSDANPTTGRTTTVTLGATNDLTLDAGIFSSTTAVVGNYVWYDEDADGIQDATEAPISGVLVTLYNSSNVSVASAVTDANGGYLFTNVTPGDYTIGFAGYPVTLVPTTKGTTNPLTADDDSNIDPITGKTDVFTVLPGSSNLTLDAGYKANPIAGLGNYVWYDVNEDGLQDATEPGISGVIVTLYSSDGITQFATAITDGNGAYSFPNLTAGTYVVGFGKPSGGFTPTWNDKDGLGINGATNSDADIHTGKTGVITLTAGNYNPNIDAGFYIGIPLGVRELKATTAVITNTSECNVNWYTVDELNTASFDIERSIDKTKFVKVGSTLANGNINGRTNYSYQDDIEKLKNASTIYYQIRLNDIDGKQTLSNIISVKTNTINDVVTVHPVPFTDVITIEYPSTESSSLNVELTDVSGRIIRTMNQEIAKGNNSIQLNGLTNIATGTYFLRIVNNITGDIYSQKLVK